MPGTSQRFKLLRAEFERVDGDVPGKGPVNPKHRKMATSPYHFLRGAAQVFYADLASGLARLPAALLEPPLTRVQGDCHFANFGFFTEHGSHGDLVVWAANDFDDAAVGHAVFDLLRFCTSLYLVADFCAGVAAGRYVSEETTAGEAGSAPTRKDAERACRAFLERYRKTCKAIVADSDRRDRPLSSVPGGHVLAKSLRKALRRAPGGDQFESKSSLGKAVELQAGRLRFRERERYARLDAATLAQIRRVFRPYVDDDILDIVRRLGAGTGSADMDRFYLLVGPPGDLAPEEIRSRDLPLAHVVEVKQQREAALIHHFPDLSPVNTLNPAHLTVDSQRQMMRRPDLILDEVVWDETHWLVRSRHHARESLDPEDMLGWNKPRKAMKQYAAACAASLARAHSRADRRSTRFEAAIAAALETAGDELVEVAERYAQRSISDHRLLRDVLPPPPG